MESGFQVREPGPQKRGVLFGGAHGSSGGCLVVHSHPLMPLLFRLRFQKTVFKACLVTRGVQ